MAQPRPARAPTRCGSASVSGHACSEACALARRACAARPGAGTAAGARGGRTCRPAPGDARRVGQVVDAVRSFHRRARTGSNVEALNGRQVPGHTRSPDPSGRLGRAVEQEHASWPPRRRWRRPTADSNSGVSSGVSKSSTCVVLLHPCDSAAGGSDVGPPDARGPSTSP